MSAMEVGHALVAAAREGGEAAMTFIRQYYDDEIVSIEPASGRTEGIEKVAASNAGFYRDFEIHAYVVEGPFVGVRADQFVVRFYLDVTPPGEARIRLTEVGIYTLRGSTIVQEEFLYLDE